MRQCGMTINPFAAWFPGWAPGDRPLSGDVSQWFRIFSPTVTVTGRGEPDLEARIVRDVATYGAQLAPITDLVLALANNQEPPAEAVAKLGGRSSRTTAPVPGAPSPCSSLETRGHGALDR
jgi:hypothetical protein